MPQEIPHWKQRLADNAQARRWNITSLLLTLPLLLMGFYYYGGQALRCAFAAVVAAVLTELVAGRLLLRRHTADDWNAVVVGLWVACMLPASLQPRNSAPLLAAVGAVFAILVVKLPFGGTMNVPFSPAAAGFAFLTVCFPQQVFHYTPSLLAPPTHDSSLALLLQQGRSVFQSNSLTGILLGQTTGPMGTGGILVIAAALLAMLILKERRSAALSSLGFVGSVALLAFMFPRVTGGTLEARLASAGMELCSGSVLFAGVFLLPEPWIMPARWFTRLSFGAVAGALVVLLRSLGSYEENVCFAILLANASVPLLYRLQAEVRHQKEFREKISAESEEREVEV